MKLALVFLVVIFGFSVNFAIFVSPQDADSENSSYKIYNGFTMLQFRYAVKIFSRENRKTLSGFSCSGSIVHQLWIITAAHCIFGFKVFDVFIGNVTNDINHVVSVTHTFIHPNYSYEPELLNDLALLKLETSLDALNNTGPTAVIPRWARFEVIPLKDCQNFFMKNFTEYSGKVICGRGIRAATCEGDSGQALVLFWKGRKILVGIVSIGYESCETVGEPEVFTRVDGYLEFIDETIKQN